MNRNRLLQLCNEFELSIGYIFVKHKLLHGVTLTNTRSKYDHILDYFIYRKHARQDVYKRDLQDVCRVMRWTECSSDHIRGKVKLRNL